MRGKRYSLRTSLARPEESRPHLLPSNSFREQSVPDNREYIRLPSESLYGSPQKSERNDFLRGTQNWSSVSPSFDNPHIASVTDSIDYDQQRYSFSKLNSFEALQNDRFKYAPLTAAVSAVNSPSKVVQFASTQPPNPLMPTPQIGFDRNQNMSSQFGRFQNGSYEGTSSALISNIPNQIRGVRQSTSIVSQPVPLQRKASPLLQTPFSYSSTRNLQNESSSHQTPNSWQELNVQGLRDSVYERTSNSAHYPNMPSSHQYHNSISEHEGVSHDHYTRKKEIAHIPENYPTQQIRNSRQHHENSAETHFNVLDQYSPYNRRLQPHPEQALPVNLGQPYATPKNLTQAHASAKSELQLPQGLLEHLQAQEDPSPKSAYLGMDSGADEFFHGKSKRSIQLYNEPSHVSPDRLHPVHNPLVKVDSPRMNPVIAAPKRSYTKSIDIHGDSCYNFLNKRRYNLTDEKFTPLEAFFLQESINQFKVASSLSEAQVNLEVTRSPPQIKRSKRYLLVLDIDETLVHSEPIMIFGKPTSNAGKSYDKTCRFHNEDGTFDEYGIRFRPFLNEFIQRMSKLFDLAVYTASARDYADVIMDVLDPHKEYFCARLYRENCFSIRGMNIKNMFNFPSTDAFIVDNLIYSFAFHMQQGIPILAFVDDPMDVELKDLAEILENLPYYPSLPELLQDLLDLNGFYSNLCRKLA